MTVRLSTWEIPIAKTINGLGMLVNQGALNLTLWAGVEAPVAVMMDTLKMEFGL